VCPVGMRGCFGEKGACWGAGRQKNEQTHLVTRGGEGHGDSRRGRCPADLSVIGEYCPNNARKRKKAPVEHWRVLLVLREGEEGKYQELKVGT